MSKLDELNSMVIQAFIWGSSRSPSGEWASVIQIENKQSFTFFDKEDNPIYEVVLDVGPLELSLFDPPESPKAQVIHQAVLTYVERMKKARER